MNRKLIFAIQSRLERDSSGVIRAPVGYARYTAWQGFLEVFDEVILVSRVHSVPESSGPAVEGPGVTVVESPYYHGFQGLVRTLPRIKNFVAKLMTEPNVFYGSRLPDVTGLMMQRRAKSIHAPFLAQVVGDPAEVLRSGVGGRPGRFAAGLIARSLRQATLSSSAVIYVTKQTLQESYPPGPTSQVLVRSNVELDSKAIVHHPRDYKKNRLNSPPRLIAVGSQEQNYKGHDLLIQATSLLKGRDISVEVTLIGGGRLHTDLVEQAESQGITDRVNFVGRLRSADEVRQYLARSDIFVMPSRTEGLPRALVEAMAAGVACIGSRVGGIPELLDEDWLFDPHSAISIADKIGELIEDPERLSAGAHQQWRTAIDISENYSGNVILATFLKSWIDKCMQ